MKAIYLKHRSGYWIARINNRQAEIFTTGHIFGFGHDFNDDQLCLKQWLSEGLSGTGTYRIASVEDFENAKQGFISHALELIQPALIKPEAKEIYLRILEEEEEAVRA
ncbi:MAG: hypothetical protein H7Y04_03110 [Verrucomicrobia bacterium]|nr:hypothetical protein [Cytophagales bacterium]